MRAWGCTWRSARGDNRKGKSEKEKGGERQGEGEEREIPASWLHCNISLGRLGILPCVFGIGRVVLSRKMILSRSR